jgi:hypothetical protein
MKRTTEAIERDLAARIKQSNEGRRETQEPNRPSGKATNNAARVQENLSKQKPNKKR